MGCEWYDPLSYGNCATDVAKSAAGDAFHSIAESFGQAADHAVNWLWGQMNAATAVHLGGKGFGLEIGMTASIAGVIAVGLFSMQIIQSVLRREPGGLGRAVKGLFVAFIAGGCAIAVVDLLLAATDSLCNGVVKVATGTDITGLGKLILGTTALTSAVDGSAALLLLSLACIAATVIVYAALVIRKVLIVVTAVFAPIAFAGSLADITVSWTRRWIETTVALVASKLILVLIFVTGYGMLIEGVGQAGSGTTQKVTQVISGVLVLFLAGFAPWLALKVVHFTGEHAQQLHALGASTVGGVAAGGRMAQKASSYVTGSIMPAGAGAGAGASAAGGAAGAGGGGMGPRMSGGPAGSANLAGSPGGAGGRAAPGTGTAGPSGRDGAGGTGGPSTAPPPPGLPRSPGGAGTAPGVQPALVSAAAASDPPSPAQPVSPGWSTGPASSASGPGGGS